MKDNRPFLVDQKQVFGEVRETTTAMNVMNGPAGIYNKSLGATQEVPNDGHDHAPSLSNKAPGARAKACTNSNNPFAFTGKPEK